MSRPDAFFREVVESSRDIVVVMAHDGRLRYVNGAVRSVLGYDDPWRAARDVFALVHEADRARVMEDFAASVDSTSPGVPITFRMRHRDGTWRHVEASGVNLLDHEAVGGFMVSLRDVTDRVEAETRHERAAARYRQALDTSPQATAIHQDGVIVYANAAAARLLGADDPEDLVDRPVGDFVPEHVAAMIGARMAMVLEGEEAGLVEEQLRRVDGSLVDVEAAGVPIEWLGRPAAQVVARDLTERNRARAELEMQATHDPLTGRPNRVLLARRLRLAESRRRQTGKRYAVVFTDLDKFKVLNDGLGHSAGDVVLRSVADRLASVARTHDTVARFGGDEFVLVLEDLEDDADVVEIVQRFADALREPVAVGANLVRVGMSGGIVVVDEDLGDRDVLSEADAALYRAKQVGRGRFEIFDRDLRHEVLVRYRREAELHEAFERNEFVAHFQVEVDVHTGAPVGAEALCRWAHPEEGLLLPWEFLHVVEEIGAIHELGDLMRERAVAALARARARGLFTDCWVSVNVAAAELLASGFVGRVMDTLQHHDVPPEALCLELTESSLASDPDSAVRIVGELRDHGVAFAVDDFGTGYASLSYLDRFSPEFVKIDRVFIDGMLTDARRLALVRSAIDIAHTFGAVTVAEGVESDAQRQRLRELGCDLIQGHLVGRPGPEIVDAS
ncbi:EAL domain-containing protein [Acidimicrobiia bacterium EGI L10123]|uniref:putative bifunctional diguanylate cyclase/phosphodiesterase n=1 Tax=Salinilacustrithrix flava TaxID=2957203 RepID=UPI003D7C27E3|nr:EAL domain-containing protein [Acidimicrobiia bacterium EGI L10123]